MNALQNKSNELRSAVYRYLTIDGLARLAGGLSLAYWIILGMDFLPVQFGYPEMPFLPRAIVLALWASFGIWLVRKYLINRLRVSISDESLFLLIERRYPEFEDRLLTMSSAGEFESDGFTHDATEGVSQDRRRTMACLIEDDVNSQLSRVESDKILNRPRLMGVVALCLLPVIGLGMAGWFLPSVLSTSLSRTFLLSAIQYERQTTIVQVVVRNVPTNDGILQLFPAVDQEFEVGQPLIFAQDGGIQLRILAQTKRPKNQNVRCKVSYLLNDGKSGSVDLTPIKRSEQGEISFVADNDFMGRISISGQFWIRIDDANQGPYSFRCLPAPKVSTAEASVNYPAYLSQSAIFEDSVQPFVNNSSFPVGTKLKFNLRFAEQELSTSSSPEEQLVDAKVWFKSDVEQSRIQVPTVVKQDRLTFQLEVARDVELFVAAQDKNGLISANPFRISFNAVQDRPPMVSVSTDGLGSAVTKNSLIRLLVEGEDEFGIRNGQTQCRFSLANEDIVQNFEWDVDRSKMITVDLLELRRAGKISISDQDLKKSPKVFFTVSLFDFNPDHPPSVGQTFEFDVVDEKRFLQLIEQEEAGLRKRLEDVYDEFEGTRPLYANLLSGAEKATKTMDSTEHKKYLENALVYIQQTRLQVQKSARDISGVCNAFLLLIKQLENNRLTVKQKQLDLAEKVAGPLRSFGSQDLDDFMARTERTAESWSKYVEDPSRFAGEQLVDQTENLIKRHNELLSKFDRILQEIVKFESQNELLDSIRLLIDEQEKLLEATQKERDRKLFEGILD